jgi:hypothetical protein
VDVFLSIPVNKIVKVFLTENHNQLKVEDDDKLSKYNLLDIYNIATKENQTEEDKDIITLFNYYYSGKQD